MDDFFYEQSTLQAFYLIDEVLIDGNPIDSDDWVVAYKGDICVGARQWDVAQCGNGVCDVPVMGDDGSIGTDGYMIVDEIPTFKVFDSSEQELLDMNFYNYYPNSEDFSWQSNSLFSLSQLINDNYSFNSNMHNFENTATITSIFYDDVYSMGVNDILVGYTNDEIRSIAISANNQIIGGYIFFSSVFLNEPITDFSFKYYNYENNLIFDTNQSFSIININDSLGDAEDPIILNIMENQELGLLDGENDGFLDDFTIINTYPNPFNPIININLDIKNRNYFEISVMSAKGEEVNQIFQGSKNIGKYDYQWDASQFPSGIYFIIIKNSRNKGILSEKICLIK